MADCNLQKIIEALMFVSEKPLTYKQILEICSGAELSEVKSAMNQLKEHYNQHARGIHIREVAGGYQFSSNPDCADYLKKLYKTRRVFRLSAPALETLAIIAYKQPITRSEIEFIRGVNVDGVVKTLEDRDLVKIKGRKEVPGKPLLYGTTDTFLHYFGLKSLQGLPSLEEFKAQNMEYTPDEQQLTQEEEAADVTVELNEENAINSEDDIAQDSDEALESEKSEEVLENGEEGDGKSEHKEAAKSN
ncbi:MAG: SMC-Scp complex subunit ScpB [Candidatus Omnitrophica bacterium]|nr:SMC-Scp complex subunit ScpB [Candidatus Omnitrophota bacterium]